jgi:shikimate dehydrogenase
MSPNFLSEIVGCFSIPAGENPTVAMMESAFLHHGLDWRYINCEVPPENLGDAVRGAKAMGWRGFNLSIPHKVSVIEYLDGLGESAKVIGAVNTVVLRDNQLIGENTDGKGFLKALQEVIDPAGKSVVVFGAGGAARAVSVELALAGASSIEIVNRTRERGQVLVDLLNDKTPAEAKLTLWDHTYALPEHIEIAINVTSIGLYPNVEERLNIDLATLKSSMVIADAITNHPRTHFIKDAESIGCQALDGLGMLVNQGVIALKYWTGENVDPMVMREAVGNALGLKSELIKCRSSDLI